MRTISPDDVLRHMEVPGERNLFVVGCFEKRVTLYSQQVRALNLVYSLQVKGRLPQGAKVAVVGAGAAGMTAAAALARLGCEVTLLEKKSSLLPLQRGNTTRYLHPHLYDWPKEGSEREEAGLPLLDWRAALADEVVRQLDQQWEALPERFRINWVPHVKSIVLGQGTPRSVSWNAHGCDNSDFDVVLLTVGFGLERQVDGVQWKSYWDSDPLHQSSRSDQTEHHLISGCGDGGLVDLLRVRLQDFRHETIVQRFLGNPALDSVKAGLLKIEDNAWGEADPNKYLSTEYRKLTIPAEVDEALKKALRQDTMASLNGLEPFPLTLQSSILNRFLVSRLIRLGTSYLPGRFTHTPEGKRYRVQFESGQVEIFDHVTCRHGPGRSVLEAEFKDIWEKCEPLRARNELDQTRWQIWPPDFFSPNSQRVGTDGSSPSQPEEPLAKSSPTAPGFDKDIKALLDYSREERRRLSKHKSLPIDGGILIPRDCLAPLRAAAESGSLLITGEPGAGKTGVLLGLADQMEKAPGPVLFLSVERFSGCHMRNDFRIELKLEHDPIEVLAAWPGSDPGLLILDALDASRGGLFEPVIASFIEEAVHKLGARWSIVASIRSFDLRNGRRFREIMRGKPPNPDFAEQGLENVRHFHVPQLSSGEMAAVAAASPKLSELEASAPDKLSKLLRNIFNLSLAAELLDKGVPPQSIRTVATQSALIREYEDNRLEVHRHRLCVKAAISVMVQRRQLSVRATDIENDAVDEVLQTGVLTPAGDRVAFAHHVLFDHMAARFYLSSDDPATLLSQVTQDPTIGLMLGPALRFVLEDVWGEDKEGRPKTWRLLADLSEVANPDPVVLSIAVRTAAECVAAPSDIAALCALIESEQRSEVVGRLVGQLARFVSMVAGEHGGLLSPVAEAWALIARFAAATKIGRLADAARVLLMTLTERAGLSDPKVLNAFGDAARALLSTAWSLSPEHPALTTAGIRFVARSYGTDSNASRALLGRILDDRFEKHAPQEAPWLAKGVASIIPHDPVFAVRIYATLFSRDITDDTKTWLGGSPSRIMALMSTRRQDYQQALWHLNQALGSFLKAAPMVATEAVIAAIRGLDAKRHGRGSLQTLTHLRIGAKDIQVFDDLLSLQDWREETTHAEYPLSAFVAFLRTCPREAFREAVMAALSRPTNAAVWARLLGVAADRPEVADDMLWPLAADPRFTVLEGLSRDSVIFLAAAYPRQPPESRSAFERVALARDLFPSEQETNLWDSVLKRFLSIVPAELIVTAEMRTRRFELEASNKLTGNPPILTGGGWEASDDDVVESLLRSWGADLERSPDREIRAASRKLEDRLKQNKQDVDATFLASLWADILDVVGLLDKGAAQEPHPKLVHLSWGAVSNGVERLAKSTAYSPGAKGLPELDSLLALIDRLSASPYPELTDTTSDQMALDKWDVRVCAASSLVALAPRFAGERPDIVNQMAACLRDPAPMVRLQVAQSLNVLQEVAREHMWALVADVADHETHWGVLRSFVAGSIGPLSHDEPERCAEFLDRVLQRDWDLRRDAQDSNRHSDDDAFADSVALLYVAHSQVLAWKWIERWASDLRRGEAHIVQMLYYLRKVFFFPYSDEPKPEQLEMALRARKLLDLVIGAAIGALDAARPYLRGTPSQEAIETWLPLYEAGDHVIHQVCSQFYFGSGAFSSPEGSEVEPGLLTSAAKQRFLADHATLLDEIAAHAQAHTVHELFKLLAYLVDGDPPGVFDRIAKVLLGPAAADRYQFEPLALDSLVELIRLYLADYRKIFEDATRRQALVAVLELFSSAGWPETLRVLFELPDLLR